MDLDYSGEEQAFRDEIRGWLKENLPENLKRDEDATLKILEKWLAKNRSPEHPKPKMVFVCVSGGGMRSTTSRYQWAAGSLSEAH